MWHILQVFHSHPSLFIIFWKSKKLRYSYPSIPGHTQGLDWMVSPSTKLDSFNKKLHDTQMVHLNKNCHSNPRHLVAQYLNMPGDWMDTVLHQDPSASVSTLLDICVKSHCPLFYLIIAVGVCVISPHLSICFMCSCVSVMSLFVCV